MAAVRRKGELAFGHALTRALAPASGMRRDGGRFPKAIEEERDMQTYEHPFSPPLPSTKPNLPSGMPPRITARVRESLETLWFTRRRMDECRAFDQRMGSGGRYEAEIFITRQHDCEAAQDYLRWFRAAAADRGIDADGVIAAFGGLPDLTPSRNGADYLSGLKGA